MTRVRAGLLVLSVALGCGNRAEEVRPSPEPEAAQPEAEPSPPAVEERSEAPAPRAVDPTIEARAREHREHLAAGRRLAREGSLEAAITELEAAHAASPNHGPTLGELGFVLFRAEQLPRAGDLTQRALQLTVEPRRRAPLLYNLGRIAEARALSSQAADHYAESLRLRPNRIVEERLRALGGAVDARAPIFSARLETAEGPFPTIEALCARSFERELMDEHSDHACRLIDDHLDAGPLSWAVLSVRQDGYAIVHLVLRAPAGHYLAAELGFIEEDSRTERGWVGALEGTLVDLVPGGSPELAFRYSGGSGYDDGCDWAMTSHAHALVCARRGEGADCFAELDLGPVPDQSEGLATLDAALGECDDDDSEEPEPDQAPVYTIEVAADRVTIGGGGPSDPRVGTHDAARAFCGLRTAPPDLVCPEP